MDLPPPRYSWARIRLFSVACVWFLASLYTLAGPGDSAPAAADQVPTFFLIGDSTMSDKPLIPAQPERGWGQLLPLYFTDAVRIRNLARNGRSSRSFRDEGRWQPVLDGLRPGDYVIIQFGHNDAKEDPKRHTDPFGSFKANLERYVSDVRERGGNPILATSIVRRAWTEAGELTDTHGDYVAAVRDAASEHDVPLLDLERRSRELLVCLGPDRSKSLYVWCEPGEYDVLPDGREDNTHLNACGASRICDLAVEEIRAVAPDLARWLRPGK